MRRKLTGAALALIHSDRRALLTAVAAAYGTYAYVGIFVVGLHLAPDTDSFAHGHSAWSSPAAALAGTLGGATGVRAFGLLGALALGLTVAARSRHGAGWRAATVYLLPASMWTLASADAAGAAAVVAAHDLRGRRAFAAIAAVAALHLEAALVLATVYAARELGARGWQAALVAGAGAMLGEQHIQARYLLPGLALTAATCMPSWRLLRRLVAGGGAAAVVLLASGAGLARGAGQLDYVDATSSLSSGASTQSGATTVLTSSALSYDGATTVKVTVYSPSMSASSVSGYALADIWEGSTDLGIACEGENPADSVCNGSVIVTPTAGTHTFTARLWCISASTCELSAGGLYAPAYLSIEDTTPSSGGGGATTLSGLTDVDTTGKADGDVLRYSAATAKWQASSSTADTALTEGFTTVHGDLNVLLGALCAIPAAAVLLLVLGGRRR